MAVLKETAGHLIRRYYDGCSSGDLAELEATLHEHVVHYFLEPNVGSAPVRGRSHLSRYWRKVSHLLDATWIVDHLLVDGDEAVIEWSMYWRPEGSEQRVGTRGSEWFLFRDGLIAEIRAYYQQRPVTTQLEDFPYRERGYSAVGRESSAIHPEPSPTGPTAP